MESAGAAKPAVAQWASPIVFVPKKTEIFAFVSTIAGIIL